MKRFNMHSMANLAFIATLGLGMLAGCGKKNKVNSNNLSSTSGSPGFGPYAPQAQAYMSQTCPYGAQRLMNQPTFSKVGGSYNGSTTTIMGPFQQGPVSGGTVSAIYVGKSTWNDLIIVSKVSNGNQLIGWNITMSMCSMSLPNGIPLISDQRALSNFQAQQGITIAEDTTCGVGKVLSAQNTYMVSAPFQISPQFDVYTSFAPAPCQSAGGGYQQQQNYGGGGYQQQPYYGGGY